MINDEPDLADEGIPGTGVLRAEVRYAADHERVVTLDDFLRRRTNLSLCHRLSEANEEMSELAETLFGDEGADRLREYREAQPNTND